MVRRSPRLAGLERSRWTLAGLRQVVPWLRSRPLGSVHRLLGRLRVGYKRGRAYLHSPDPAYDAKLAAVTAAQAFARADPGRVVLLYEDEFTYHRRPTVARAWAPRGADAPRVAQGLSANKARRIAACLDALTGRVIAWQRRHFDHQTLLRFYQATAAAYPAAAVIFIAQDNWPVHFHPALLAALAETPIRLLPLPTYAPWTNPTEDLWRGLYADVLHHHGLGDDWAGLQTAVDRWLDRWRAPSATLLRMVGLPYPV